MKPEQTLTIDAEPYPFEFTPATCALLIIDMQRDFCYLREVDGPFPELIRSQLSR